MLSPGVVHQCLRCTNARLMLGERRRVNITLYKVADAPF